MSRKNRKDDGLDTETTFSDMNVEGFKWHDSSKKNGKGKQTNNRKISRKEYWQLVRGMFAAVAPAVFIFFAAMSIVAILLYLWLK